MTLISSFKKMLISMILVGVSSGAVHAMDLIQNLTYGEKPRNQLDLYLPDSQKSSANPPIIVFIHGGRWFRNDKTQFELYNRIPQAMEAGYAVAAINYTFSNEAVWPAQLEDLRNAFDFIRENGDQYGYNAEHIAVWGQSSGAHLALWAAFDQAQNPNTRLDALVSWYAPSDLRNIVADREYDNVRDRGNLAQEPTPESLLIGQPVAQNLELADAASPYRKLLKLPLTTQLPPSLLVHGEQDFVVSPLQTERLYNEMKKRSGVESVEVRYVENGQHGGNAFNDEVSAALQFLDSVFKNHKN